MISERGVAPIVPSVLEKSPLKEEKVRSACTKLMVSSKRSAIADIFIQL